MPRFVKLSVYDDVDGSVHPELVNLQRVTHAYGNDICGHKNKVVRITAVHLDGCEEHINVIEDIDTVLNLLNAAPEGGLA